ncbi:Fc.00g014860.m01.CDS01 [Cosmosporella sp. VM-42]
MANNHRPGDRRGSGYRDRERVSRDRDYREHDQSRFHENTHDLFPPRRASDFRDDPNRSRERERERERDLRPSGSNREAVNANRASADTSSSIMSPLARNENTSDKASVASNMSKSDAARNTLDHDLRRLIDIEIHLLQWKVNGAEAEKAYKKRLDDRRRADTRHAEFASVEDMFDRQLKRFGQEKSRCKEKADGLYQELVAAHHALFSNYRLSSPPSSTPAPPAAAALPAPLPEAHPAQDVEIKGLSSDIDGRLVASQNAIIATCKSEMQLELKRLREEMKCQHESEMRQLKSQYESQTLEQKKSIEQQSQKTQLLEQKLEDIEKEIRSGPTHMKPQTGAVDAKLVALTADVNHNRDTLRRHESDIVHLKRRADELEAKHKTSATNNIGAMNKVRDNVRKFEQDTYEAKRRADEVNSKLTAFSENINSRITNHTSKITAQPGHGILDARVNDTLKNQDDKISSMLGEIKLLKDQVSQQRTLYDDAHRKLQSIETSVGSTKAGPGSTNSDKFIEVQQKLEKLENQINDHDATLKSYDERYNSLQISLSELQSRVAGMQAEYKKLVPDLKRLKLEADATRGKAMALMEDLNTLREDVETKLKKAKPLAHESRTATEKMELLLREMKTVQTFSESLIQQPKSQEQHAQTLEQKPETGTPSSIPTTQVDNGGPYASMTDLQAVSTEVEKFKVDMSTQVTSALKNSQMQVSNNSRAIGAYLDREREARDALEANVTELSGKVSSLEQTVETNKASHTESAKKLQDHMHQMAHDIASQRQDITSARQEACQAVGGIEAMQFQLNYFNNWRNNFSSKSLYKQIVDHILATIPAGIPAQMRNLAERMSKLEYAKDEQASKKRKLANGNAVAVNGK